MKVCEQVGASALFALTVDLHHVFFYGIQKLAFPGCMSSFLLLSVISSVVVATQCVVIYFMTGVNQHSGAVSSPAMWDFLWYQCMCSINMVIFKYHGYHQ